MATNKTANYGLPRWDYDDQIRMDDFNDLTKKLDDALKANADATAGKAEASALTAETEARESADSALTASLASLGKNLGASGHNARIAFGSYTGSGVYGSASPNTITCDFYPVLVFLCNRGGSSDTYFRNPTVMLRPRTLAPVSPEGKGESALVVSWADASVSWYQKLTTSGQFNASNTTYYWVALGYDKSAEESA